MSIRAATKAGGQNNQDRHAHGDGWAFVLDGASSFVTVEPEHDGSWYAERLKTALVDELTSAPEGETIPIVARAIKHAASAHSDHSNCPSSTIALARWNSEEVELYVLGDSTAAAITTEDEIVLTDTRMAKIAPDVRERYRSRLRAGYGFDEQHRQALRDLQCAQARDRNTPFGYWIAGSDPNAARHGLSATRQRKNVKRMVLATDGAAACLRYGVAADWTEFANRPISIMLQQAHELESKDANARTWPRSKVHDDKTALTLGH